MLQILANQRILSGPIRKVMCWKLLCFQLTLIERNFSGIKQFIEANFDKFTESLSAGTTIDAEIVSISDTGVYMKTQNNITASLKLLQKELKSILEDDTLKFYKK